VIPPVGLAGWRRRRVKNENEKDLLFEVLDEYRRKAEACRRLADLALEAEGKVLWIEQASEWDRRAITVAKRSRARLWPS
jgi:hypothetical protein